MSFKRLIDIFIMFEDRCTPTRISNEDTLEDLKLQIEKCIGTNMTSLYIFYGNQNLLDIYNTYTISQILKEFGDDHDNTFFVLNIDDYNNLLKKTNVITCLKHQFSLAYLFCTKCKEILCELCKDENHINHEKISDYSLVMNNYYLVLQQYEKKVKQLFGKRNISNDLDSNCSTMLNNLKEYIKNQIDTVEKSANGLKNLIDDIKDVEILRLKNMHDAAEIKIKDFENEAKEVYNMFKKCKDGLSTRQVTVETFAANDFQKKHDFLVNVQRDYKDVINKLSKVEQILEKVTNPNDYDISSLIEVNKDHNYSLTISKLDKICKILLEKLKEKEKSEIPKKILNKMEIFRSKTNISKVYNKALNVSENNFNKILQPIDGTNMVNVFDFDKKKVIVDKIVFNKDSFISQFPFYSRSINILGNLYITGGEIDGNVINYFIMIDNTMKATMMHSMNYRRSGHSLVNVNNTKLIVISGSYTEKSCELYDFGKKIWSILPSVNQDRVGSTSLVVNSETIYLFFGKKWSSMYKRWNFVTEIEMINLFERTPKWINIYFKSNISSSLRQRAFSSLICCPDNKVYLIGGQTIFYDGKIEAISDTLEIDIDNHVLSKTDLVIPRPCCFLESNFYFFNSNALNFDNEGNIFFYSLIYHEMWTLD